MSSISGFPELLPAQQLLFEKWKKNIASYFELYAFLPLETPAVERINTLLSKGDDHEIYVLERYGDSRSKKELGLRFDLTVPLARYITSYHGQLVFPYRRYHIAPVWRGERPQEGRYRQFYQCDIDVVGQGQLSVWHESELIFMMNELLNILTVPSVLGPVKWLINHRSLLINWATRSGVTSSTDALRIIDKRGKMPFDHIMTALKDQGASTHALNQLEKWSLPCDSWEDKLKIFKQLEWGPEFEQGVQELEQILKSVSMLGILPSCITFDPLLARGLGYYSGAIFEAVLSDHLSLGAICAGGRYDRLTETLSAKHKFPGVGLSLGLSRLFSLFLHHASPSLCAGDILITTQESPLISHYLALGQMVRSQGLKAEVYLEPHPLPHQLKYAHRKGFPFVAIANKQELDIQMIQLKHMVSGEQNCVSFSDIAEHITKRQYGFYPNSA